MNISEANDTNVLLRWILGVEGPSGDLPSDEQAQTAAARLAGRAHKALHAGMTGQQVTDAWPKVCVGP